MCIASKFKEGKIIGEMLMPEIEMKRRKYL